MDSEFAELLQKHTTILQQLLEKHTSLVQEENKALRETVVFLFEENEKMQKRLVDLEDKIAEYNFLYKEQENRLKIISIMSENAQKMAKECTIVTSSMIPSIEKAITLSEQVFARSLEARRFR